MAKKPDISEEEQSLFREAMRGVKVISAPKKATTTLPRPPSAKKMSKSELSSPLNLSDCETENELSSADLVEFTRGGVQHKVLRKLRSGQYNVEAILDLHGMTVAQARTNLEGFLSRCWEKGLSYLLIIHGKGRLTGKPVLKNKLNLWLKQVPFILAFCSAKHQDRSSGAMYVMLKTNKPAK